MNPSVVGRRVVRRAAASSAGLAPRRAVLTLTLAWAAWTVPAAAQYDFSDEPLLPSTISKLDVEMRGRYVGQWPEADGTLVLLVNGGLRLEMGQRRMTANNGVVWIVPGYSETEKRKYFDLTVYLSESAEIEEPGGTVTMDNVLLVRGLRTSGQIIKREDAHSPENMQDSPLYQQALRDRALIEAAQTTTAPAGPAVARPEEIRHPAAERPPRVVRYRLANIEPAHTATGEQVFVATGGVYFSQAGGPDAPMLEIRADNAVVFSAAGGAGFLGGALSGEQRREHEDDEVPAASEPAERPTQEPASRPRRPRAGRPPGSEGLLGLGQEASPGQVQGVYLEGDVVLSTGTRFIRAHRLYYDFEHDRALILDAVFRADIPARGIPFYIRAAEIRQLSAREYSAENAVVTTSEFYLPSYHVGAERVYLRDVTARDAEGRTIGATAGSYELRNATLNVGGAPLLWWPYSQGTFETSETLIRHLSVGFSRNFGAEFESSWNLFNLLGVQSPPGFDTTLRLDYFSRRGPAVGIDVDYERDTYFGLLRSYFIDDQGRDHLGPLRKNEEEPSSTERGRVLWRHRHYLPNDWEVTFELAYVSDPNFLEEYEKREFQTGKEQETSFYLKHAKDNEAITLLANWRMLDFLTQTEHLPDFTYRRIGDTFLDPLVSYTEGRFGMVRYLPDDRHFLQERHFSNLGRSDLTVRGDAREELEWPAKVGPVNVVPFASVRGSYWDGQPLDQGALWRGLAVYGVRGSSSFSRVFSEPRSELFDINGIRHIVTPEYAAWWAHSNTRSEKITPFDYGIETIDAFYGGKIGVRQAWQTKRGREGQQRTVDLVTLNLEAGAFGNTRGRKDKSDGWADPLRPEDSRSRNYLAGDLMYRLSDTTTLLYDFNFDLNDRSYDMHNVSVAVERDPRLSYVFGARYAGDIQMSLIGGGWNYKLSEKHITAVRAWWDVDTGRLGQVTVSYIRKLPRWYVGLNLSYDQVNDDFSLSMSLWPEGVPEWTLGSKRFTPLGTTTGIRP